MRLQTANRWRRCEKARCTRTASPRKSTRHLKGAAKAKVGAFLSPSSPPPHSAPKLDSPQPRTWSAGSLLAARCSRCLPGCLGWMFNSLATPAAHAGWSALAPKLICVLYYFIPSPAPRHFFSGFNHFASNRHSARRVRRKIIIVTHLWWCAEPSRAARTHTFKYLNFNLRTDCPERNVFKTKKCANQPI